MLEKEQLQKAIDQYIDVYCVESDQTKKGIANKKHFFDRMLGFLNGRPYTLQNVLEFRTKMYKNWKTPEGHALVTRMLIAFTNWLFEYEYLDINFSKKLNKPKVSKPQFEYIEPARVIEIILAGTEPKPFVFGRSGDNERNIYIKNETRLCLLFLLWTGLRIKEAIGITGDDLALEDDNPSYWVNTKGNKHGEKDYLPIPRVMVNEMRKRKSRKRVFEVTASTCNKALQRGCEILGIVRKDALTCHDLRHIYATNATKEGNPIQLIAKSLRHKKVQRTMDIYLHLDNSDIAKMNNNQKTVRAELKSTEWIEIVEKAIKNTGVEDAANINISWEQIDGRFTFSMLTK